MKFAYIEHEDSVTVLRCYGTQTVVELPKQIGGKDVRALADHIFAGSRSEEYPENQIRMSEEDLPEAVTADDARLPEICFPEEVILPDTVRSIGSYAFYGCRTLHRLTIPSRLEKLGRGVFTACNHIVEIRFFEPVCGETGCDTVKPADTLPCMRNILGELEYEVRLSLQIGKCLRWRLLFPGYYEESIENTPARIIEIKFEGTGYKYRQCIRGGQIDLIQYDSLFYLARVQERAPTAVQIAMLRLAFPAELKDVSRKEYLDFLKESESDCADFVLRSDDRLMWLQVLAGEHYFSREMLEKWMDRLAAVSDAGALSLLMDYRRREFPVRKKQFSLL